MPKSEQKLLISFDYSITSPSMTIWDGIKYRSWVVSSEKKIVQHNSDFFEIIPIQYPLWTLQQERYDKLSSELFTRIPIGQDVTFGIESYSMGSRGRVFDIAEATQTLKYKVWKEFNQQMVPFAPTTVKKDFTGKGNSDKTRMAEVFYERFGFWMHDQVQSKVKGSASDLVDSIAVNLSLQAYLKNNGQV